MPRDQDRGQSVRVFLSVSGVRAAPRQELEQKLVVAPVGKVDRFAPFDSGRLARELRGVLALLDDAAAPKTGADVVAAAVPERPEPLVLPAQAQNPGVLRLAWSPG